MSDEMRVDTGELRKLGAIFATYAQELDGQLDAFRRRTDSGAQPLPYADLAERMELVIGQLRQKLDEIGHGMHDNARRTAAADDETAAEMMRGVL